MLTVFFQTWILVWSCVPRGVPAPKITEAMGGVKECIIESEPGLPLWVYWETR